MGVLSANDVYKRMIGKKIDIDGFPKEQPFQCYDPFALFCRESWGFTPYCRPSGYVRDFAENFKGTGLDKYFTKVKLADAKDGDWIVWGKAAATPWSHIAMFRKFVGNNILALQQNAPYPYVTQNLITKNGVIAVLRPKRPSAPKPTPKPKPSTSRPDYQVKKTVNGYISAADAKKRKNKRSTVRAGYYYVFNKADGMVNVTTKKGVPGSWINPGDNSTAKPSGLKKGDTVVFTKARSYTNQILNVSGKYTVMEVKGSRVVVGRRGVVTAAVNKANLRKA